MTSQADVIVIGAGAAGITAAVALAQAGKKVTVLEARNRIGGRIFTLRDPVCDASVELGAEFIHGKPPELWNLFKRQKVKIREIDGDNWCLVDGRLSPCDFSSQVDNVLDKMDARQSDQSFLEFINNCCPASTDPHQQHAREWAIRYVSGFNAADPALVGVHWLVKGMRAEEKIEGDRIFRAENGYTSLIDIFQEQLDRAGVTVQTNTVVESIDWRRGHVEVSARGPAESNDFSAAKALITVPAGVLQARSGDPGAIRFTPGLPKQKQNAIRDSIMGKVIRVTLRFRERFWKDLPYPNLPNPPATKSKSKSKTKNTPPTMDNMSFLFSPDEWFPTWWTTFPEKLPLLIGWAPFHAAERLSGRNESFIAEQALATLHRVLGISVEELNRLLEHAYVHDWQNDPFSRGAYSYGKVGAENATAALAKPVQSTLFFAGEATETGGHNGTVHGAIASGQRAAKEIR
jgi:monoamine oxidase